MGDGKCNERRRQRSIRAASGTWGYGALWVPEVTARDPFVTCSWLLANTTTLNLATGIASIYSHDSFAAINSQYALAEQSDGRFLLGLGVSHGPFVEGVLGHKFEKPAPHMKRYLAEHGDDEIHGPAACGETQEQ